MKGLIALDIDGTTTASMHGIPKRTQVFLRELHQDGWGLAFITGRPFCMASLTLAGLAFPYHLAIQNGVTILSYPTGEVVHTTYLNQETIQEAERAFSAEPFDFIVYGGYHTGDRCFYRPQRFSSSLLEYLRKRMKVFGEDWIEVEDFSGIALFAALKGFGDVGTMRRLSEVMEKDLGLNAPGIADPFDRAYQVVQGTHSDVDKGKALRRCYEMMGGKGPIIVAGDDVNDIPMLKVGDVRVVMSTACEALRSMAHVLAPPASEEGIIEGLRQAIHRLPV